MRKLGIGAAAGVVGLLAIGAAIVASHVQHRQRDANPAESFASPEAGGLGQLAQQLLRCQAIGIKAADNAACGAAWAENRRRFFAPLSGTASLAPTPGARPPQ